MKWNKVTMQKRKNQRDGFWHQHHAGFFLFAKLRREIPNSTIRLAETTSFSITTIASGAEQQYNQPQKLRIRLSRSQYKGKLNIEFMQCKKRIPLLITKVSQKGNAGRVGNFALQEL